jgi:transposase
MITDENISGKVLDHLGLVATTIEKIGLIGKIDSRLPLANSKTTMGQRIAAMIFNGLGFIDDRLYMFPEFLSNKPIDRLFKGNLRAENFNDDALGRCLDSIYEYGVTKLFSEIAFEIGIEQKLLGRTFNVDTTSLTVYGEYEEVEINEPKKVGQDLISSDPSEGATPKHGYSKDHRPDLKQMVLNLATTGSAGFPIWMEAHSGNASDKKILQEAAKRMSTLCKGLKEAPSFMTVGDSAIYDACIKEAGDMLWLTRVPERHKAAKNLLQYSDETYGWRTLSNGYKICVVETRYRNVHQRWAIVYSEQAYQRECKTMEKHIQSIEEKLTKELWHLGNQTFHCENDANDALTEFNKKLSYHKVSATITPLFQHKGKGRPTKDAIPKIIGYQITGELSRDDDKIAIIRNGKGRFLLATNQLDIEALPDEDILSEYKGQSKTESGFKFIKDDTFEVSSIFLKKPGRIAALMMVMTLCLMIYAIAQFELRSALAAAEDTIPTQTKKETCKPSMKWVYRLFQGVQVITLTIQEVTQEIVINLKAVQKKIIRYFGVRAMEIYGIT